MNRQVDENIRAFVTRSAIPKLEVGIWHNGAMYHSSYGGKTHADVFEIGSVGKTLTATLLAVFAEQKLVRLTDKVDKFKPELPFSKVINLLQLANHTSGLPSNPFNGVVLAGQKAVQEFSHVDYKNYLGGLNKPLKTGNFRYSNIGTALLGNLLADHVGSTYEAAVKNTFLSRLV